MKEELQKSEVPKIKLPGLNLSDNQYVYGTDKYDVPTLIQFCKEKKYPVFDLPLAGIYMGNMPFDVSSFLSFCNHVKRINKTSLDYPILIDNSGYVADGWHRIAKAIIKGNVTIKAIRMMEMPEPSGKDDKD